MISAELRKPTRPREWRTAPAPARTSARHAVVDRDGAEPVHERHQDQQAEPERRQRQPAQADHAQHIVERRVLPHRADHAQRHADDDREEQRQSGQPRGDRDARRDLVQHRLFRDIGIAEIAVEQPVDPLHVLHRDRLIQAEIADDLPPSRPDRSGRRNRTGCRRCCRARCAAARRSPPTRRTASAPSAPALDDIGGHQPTDPARRPRSASDCRSCSPPA